jgi:hypothetical protein
LIVAPDEFPSPKAPSWFNQDDVFEPSGGGVFIFAHLPDTLLRAVAR